MSDDTGLRGNEGGDRPRPEASRGDLHDRELMARLARGEREALAPLMDRHYRRLYRIALAYLRQPEDALDVVQEAFVKTFVTAPRWDRSLALAPWLSRVTVNLAIDRWRRTRRRAETFTPMADSDHLVCLADQAPSADSRLQATEAAERLRAALGLLPERQRAIVVLRHYQDLSLEEIAQTLGIRVGTVKSSLHRALRRLRAGFAGGCA